MVIYALAGRININLDKEEIALINGRKIFMKDLWPLNKDVHKLMDEVLKEDLFKKIMKKFLAVIQIGKLKPLKVQLISGL